MGRVCAPEDPKIFNPRIDPDMRKDGEREEMLQPPPREFPSPPGARGWNVPAGVGFIAALF